jgi:hypothetical protein
MILEKPEVQPEEFAQRTGWIIKPEGACKGEVCVSLPSVSGPALDVTMLAERLHMPLVRDEAHGLWCLGPESGGKVLATARGPRAAPARVARRRLQPALAARHESPAPGVGLMVRMPP